MNSDRALVEELIYDSCMALDQNDYSGFLRLCDERFEYTLTAFSPEIKKDMTWLEHNRFELGELFDTLPKHNSDHSPLTRNAVVYKVSVDDANGMANVITALQIFRTELDGGETRLFAVGKYYDTVSLSGKLPTLVKRHVKLDTRDLGWGYHVPF